MDAHHAPDEELMAKVKAREQPAFVALFDRYRESAVSFAGRMTGDADSAEELARAAFVQAASKAPSFPKNASFRVWFFSILEKLVSEHVELHRPEPRASLRRLTEAEAVSEGADILENEARPVFEALNRLGPQLREALYLRLFERMSCEEVAEILGESPEKVVELLAGAIGSLRNELD